MAPRTRPSVHALGVVFLALALTGPALAAPVLRPAAPLLRAFGAWGLPGTAADGYASVARATFARAAPAGVAWGSGVRRPAVPDLLVDTAADDAPNATSTADCTDGVADGDCSLREAIEVANANVSLDVIGFDIPAAGGVATLQPTSELPALTDAGITIDGYSQPGASPNALAVGTDAVLRVEIDGQFAGAVVGGLTLEGPDQEIRGLVINRFNAHAVVVYGAGATIIGNYVGTDAAGTSALGNRQGIYVAFATDVRVGTDGDGVADADERNVISGNDNSGVWLWHGSRGSVIAGNYVGTNAAGDAALGNGGQGVSVFAPDVRIGTNGDGTADAAERNVISGNDQEGVKVSGPSAVIAGNYVGTNAAGDAALGNGGHGVFVVIDRDVRIGTNGDGTADAAERNVISGNDSSGVTLRQSTGSVIAGNYIGTNAAGTAALANHSGVYVFEAPDVRIGTDGDGVADEAEANVISGNTSSGVHISAWGGSASVLGNAVHDNGSLGIDLGGYSSGDGVTPNDADDPDTGPNGLQNFPVLTSAIGFQGVQFTLDSTPNTTFRVEFFASDAADPSGYGEGARFLTFAEVTTDPEGDALGTVSADGLTPGESVAATATPITGLGAFGGTSEFSAARAVVALDYLLVDTVADDPYVAGTGTGTSLAGCTDGVADGDCSLREAIEVANANATLDEVAFEITAAHGADPATGVATITVATALPALTDPGITIDGRTQPGWSGATASAPAVLTIALVRDPAAGGFDGLTLGGATQTVRSLAVGGFAGSSGIFVAAEGAGAVVAGSHLGTDAAGTAALPNRYGIRVVEAPDVRIGTDGDGVGDAAERNVISGNSDESVYIVGQNAAGAVVAGNLIGTNAAGTAALANHSGVYVFGAPDVRIGTDGDGVADEAERNVVSGNTSSGIFIAAAGATGAVVAGNFIGTDATGTAALGNSIGISVGAGGDVRIGTDGDGVADAAERNVISGNTSSGVYISDYRGGGSASVLGNAVHDNGSLGIDLGGRTSGDGVTLNDADDPDTGASGLQNFPVLTSASTASVTFSLDSTPGTDFRVELFASDAADPTGYGEGARVLGVVEVTTDVDGDARGSFPGSLVAVGDVLSLTATPITGTAPTTFGGTSEFSLTMAVDDGLATSATLDGAEGWRMLASPEATTLGGFLGALWTQGYAGSDAPAGACTVYVYDETGPTFTDGWTCATDAADVLDPGEGVMAYVFADDDFSTPGVVDGGFPKTLTASAAVAPPASFSFAVAYSDGGRLDDQKGWNLLGVPHGASLAWEALDRSGVATTAYVYDPAYNGGDYLTATHEGGVVFGDLPDGQVPPFQGFFVQALATGPSLVATAAAAEPAADVHGRTAATTVVRLSLADASGERSVAWVALVDGAAVGPDAADAPRLEPTAWPRAVVLTMAVGADVPLVANMLPPDLGGAASADVPLDVTLGGFTGEVALTLTATAEALPDGWTLTLVDRATGTETPLADGAPAAFTMAGDASGITPPAALALPASLASPTALARLGSDTRFVLRIATEAFVTALPGDDVLTTGLGLVFPNPTSGAATLTWALAEAGEARLSVVDLLGREVAVLAAGPFAAGVHRAEVPAGRLAPGVYVVRLQAGTATEAVRLTVVR